jgi:acetyl esterase/lipase
VLARCCLVLAALLAVGGCGGSSPPAEVTQEYLPGRTVTMVQPATPGPAPLVVAVPGGGWQSADPAGLVPLAQTLAADGATVVLVTYRTSADGAYFPRPVRDVACGVAVAAAMATDAGHPPSEVVVLGHSAGAQLAALVALTPARFASPSCPAPPVAPDRLVGLAGPYDVELARDAAVNLFGRATQWDAGNPMLLADRRPGVPVLLVHGTADTVVPTAMSGLFADALTAGGHDVTREWPDGVDHAEVYQPEVAGPLVAAWLGLAPAPTEDP